MLKKLFFLIELSALIITVSCKKETESNAASEPAVVGYLVQGQPISVKVYQQKELTDTVTYGPLISGLSLNISDGSKTIQLTESSTGTYTYDDVSFLKSGKTYTLNFTYNNTVVSASTVMPAKPTGYTASRTSLNVPSTSSTTYTDSVAVNYNWNNPDSLYHVLVFKNDDTYPYGILSRPTGTANFTINTKHDASYTLYYHTINYIGTYKVILYNVNEEYINLLNSNANTNSQNLTNPPTNVTNGFGIFTAMQADTISLTLTHN